MDAGTSSPHQSNPPQLLDAVAPEPGMQLQMPAARPSPKQETVTAPLNLSEFLRALRGGKRPHPL